MTTETASSGNLGDRALGAVQNLGRSLMLPIAVLPAAALLLRLGQDDLLGLPWMAAAGDAIFANLPIIFAIGIAVGLTGGEGAAGLAAIVGYLVFAGVFDTVAADLAEDGARPIESMGVLSWHHCGARSHRPLSTLQRHTTPGLFGVLWW